MDQKPNAPKTPKITQEEKELIDQAIKEGKLTRYPTGTTGIRYDKLDTWEEIQQKNRRIFARQMKFIRAHQKKRDT